MPRNDGAPAATDATERLAVDRSPAETPDAEPAPTYANEPGTLDNIADKLGFRTWLEKRPALKHSYRVGVGVLGTVVVAVGLVLVPLPGPGWLIVIAGLAILATEFEWAARLLRLTRRYVTLWTDWVNRQRMWVRLVIGLAVLAFVYGVVVVTLHLTGVPDWVPSWVPLWR